ncbi:hypothetical protein KFK09_004207 [Dendrobium nobile]|uniref:Uncharacterized protein n=1 Tax=Dendrobium nobile TaxID=94219 RepID=A0A8T3BZX2_DENNO|nr:hypothetical protein KFK09_004207 [Dendrobium nobile]
MTQLDEQITVLHLYRSLRHWNKHHACTTKVLNIQDATFALCQSKTMKTIQIHDEFNIKT